MKPPRCRLCGHEHWNNAPHVWEKGGRNQSVTTERNQIVTSVANKVVTCNQCVTKEAEIAKLRAQVLELMKGPGDRPKKPKRDRAAYMRKYRGRPLGIAYG